MDRFQEFLLYSEAFAVAQLCMFMLFSFAWMRNAMDVEERLNALEDKINGKAYLDV